MYNFTMHRRFQIDVTVSFIGQGSHGTSIKPLTFLTQKQIA